jgi:dihydropteroate synthase
VACRSGEDRPCRRRRRSTAYFDDVVADVRAVLVERVERAVEAGIPRDRIIIDPGHDLDKNTLHSLEITRRLDEIADVGLPLLAAVSNKDFVGEVLDREKAERLVGSLAAMVMCVERGARILRMHDVPASVDAVRMIEAVMGWRAPVRLVHNTHPTHNV